MKTNGHLSLSIFTVIALLLASCQVEHPPNFSDKDLERVAVEVAEPEEQTNDHPIEQYYHQLIKALATGDSTDFNRLVHPEFGCYLIESPGAIPIITRVTNIEMIIQSGAGRPVLDFSSILRSLELKEEVLPVVDCDSPDGFYTKSGTFVQDINTLAELKIWEHIGLKDTDQVPISKLAKTVKKTIVNTLGFTLYFSQINEGWYLTFFDIRIPCTA
ncbi:MAG: hypothetical protein JKY52_11665 [Flavobacteriales bacterium]|nr:hypothetical protein [Flavobacteriales bacterium]